MLLMQDYSDPKYDNLYEEILLDYHYRFPKYHPIPYPLPRNVTNEKKNTLTTIRKGH